MSELPSDEVAGRPEDADWDDFRVFLEVVRTGSFNRAAAKLKMTQPTVSRRLQRLEEAIGARLFDRDRRGPRLTVEGQRIYNDTCAAQAALIRATNQVPGVGRPVEGDCKIFMGEGVATYWMSRFIAPFFTRHPNIELKIFGSSDPTLDKRELSDLHVHYFEPSEAEPVAVRLGTMHFVPFASREYLRIHGVPRSIEALSRHRLIDLAVYLPDMGSWASWSRGEVTAHALLFTNLTGCLAESVRHGGGIAFLPTYAATVDENFVALELGVRFTIPIYVNYHRDAMKRWSVRATLDFLRDHVFDQKNMPWFQESHVMPESDWGTRLARFINRAATAPDSNESHPDRVSGRSAASQL